MLFVTMLHQPRTTDATMKAKNDVVRALEPLGFHRLGIERFPAEQLQWNEQIHRIAGLLGLVGQNDTVVYQFPNYMGMQYEGEIVHQIKYRGANEIGLIHDVDYIRFGTDNVADYIKMFNEMDALIVLSEKMKERLASDGVKTPMFVRGPWDYFIDVPLKLKRFRQNVYYAGNLSTEKSQFLDNFPHNIHVDAFGPELDLNRKLPNNIDYHGAERPSLLPNRLSDGFGLIWDGTSIEQIKGNYGDYLEYNLSHKLSLFLGSELPVIVSKEDSVSPFVEKNHVGLTVDSLTELPELLNHFSQDDYFDLLKNVKKVSPFIRSGRFTQLVVLEVLQSLALQGEVQV